MNNYTKILHGQPVRLDNDLPKVLAAVEHLANAGFALHRLHRRSKRPIGDDWSTKAVPPFNQLVKTYRNGENIGVRLGQWSKVRGYYLHVIDLDIRTTRLADEARTWLSKAFPEWRQLPTVISGSGGESRHVYLLCERPFASKKLAHSTEKVMDDDGKMHWAWEIELFGTGKQVVLPPSIHPDTGRPYAWLQEFDFDALKVGHGPILDADRIEDLIGAESLPSESGNDRSQRLNLSEAEIRDTLADLPAETYCDDRDGWLTVGMALHYETAGSDAGFDLWSEFSKRSTKFDTKDQKRVWRSFKGKAKPTTMATLISAARDARLDTEIDDLGDDDADDLVFENQGRVIRLASAGLFADLLGDDAPAPVTKRQEKLNKGEVEHGLGHVPAKVKRLNAGACRRLHQRQYGHHY